VKLWTCFIAFDFNTPSPVFFCEDGRRATMVTLPLTLPLSLPFSLFSLCPSRSASHSASHSAHLTLPFSLCLSLCPSRSALTLPLAPPLSLPLALPLSAASQRFCCFFSSLERRQPRAAVPTKPSPGPPPARRSR
jgi:hypothetical protein